MTQHDGSSNVTFKKVDLHIHTPESACYEDHFSPEENVKTSPQDIVNAAIGADLEAIVITDHNSVEGIDPIREAARRSSLIVLPGLEVSARGGHVLAIFNEDTPVQKLRHLVQSLGFQKEQQGDGYYQSEFWADEVFHKIVESGGLAIAAHIDRTPRGFVAGYESLADKRRIHSSRFLTALEITVPQDRFRWRQGLVPGYPKKYPCIQGSDAHSAGEIGRRPMYLRIPRVSLKGLRLAFREYQTRIRFPDELADEVSI